MAEHNNGPPSVKDVRRIGYVRATGVFMLGLSAIVTAVIAWVLSINNNDLRKESACRFEASTTVNAISDNIDALTAELFVAAIADPRPSGTPANPEVQRIVVQIDDQVHQLRPAIEARNKAVEDCDKR